jgi:hypothetical protein
MNSRFPTASFQRTLESTASRKTPLDSRLRGNDGLGGYRFAARGILSLSIVVTLASAQPNPSIENAKEALRRATTFFRNDVSTEGGYLWQYSADLAKREGEGKADADTIWVQPPGTPSVGQAFLHAYRRTGDRFYLDAARDAAMALVRGQLQSGGWDYRIHFDDQREKYAYRVDESSEGRNVLTLDDDVTQSATRLLMDVDAALDFENETIHEAAMFALDALLDGQYPNGAWPQRFSSPPDPDRYPVKKARYPESWPRTHPDVDYRDYYTFNDNTITDTIALMFDAADTYGDEKYRDAAIKAADFILLAQMPEPQPAWAQQYNADMEPAWARRFEPASVTGGESQGIMQTLLAVYRRTGDVKYLDAVERALAYLQKSALPDGQLARFYELKTNTPLYFTKEYELTYDDSDMPTHYSFKLGNKLESIARALTEARETPAPVEVAPPSTPTLTDELAAQAQTIIDRLDDRGAWVEDGRLRYHGDDDPTRRIISSRTFATNVRTLADYIAAVRNEQDES